MSARINEQGFIPYIQQNLRHLPNCNDVAMSLVRRYGYPGADELLLQSFNAAFARGDYRGAARVVATMKSGALRTPQTINQFKSVPPQGGQPSAILVYFQTVLDHTTLNANESLELVRPVVTQGRKEFIVKWLDDDKLECTEALGDVVKPLDLQLAIRWERNGYCVCCCRTAMSCRTLFCDALVCCWISLCRRDARVLFIFCWRLYCVLLSSAIRKRFK